MIAGVGTTTAGPRRAAGRRAEDGTAEVADFAAVLAQAAVTTAAPTGGTSLDEDPATGAPGGIDELAGAGPTGGPGPEGLGPGTDGSAPTTGAGAEPAAEPAAAGPTDPTGSTGPTGPTGSADLTDAVDPADPVGTGGSAAVPTGTGASATGGGPAEQVPADAPPGLVRRLEAPGAAHRSADAPVLPPGHARRIDPGGPTDGPAPTGTAGPAPDAATPGLPEAAGGGEAAAPASPARPHDDDAATPVDPALPTAALAGRAHRPEAVAPAPAAPAAPGPVHEQVAVRIRDLRIEDGDQFLTVDLHPAELGAVNVEVRVADGVVHVTVRAEEPAAARLLEHHLDDLGQALDAGGLDVGELDVAPALEAWRAPAPTAGERDLLDRPARRGRDEDPTDLDRDRHPADPDDHLAFDALL